MYNQYPYQYIPGYYQRRGRPVTYGEPFPMPPVPLPQPMPVPPPVICPEPEEDYYTYPDNLPDAIALIREAVSDERTDEMFYEYMLKMAHSKEDKKIIESIRNDERKHNVLFRNIYCQLTGELLPPGEDAKFTPPKRYCDGIKQALFGELSAVEKYRRILYALQNRTQINKMTEIITDEQKHADKWNYLYSKNDCCRY